MHLPTIVREDPKTKPGILQDVGFLKEVSMMELHPFGPVWDSESRVLILGSFPSVKSREIRFFYGHPQNRFWRVLAAVFGDDPGETPEQKTAFLLRHHVALWDVIQSCEIVGSADSSIRNVVPNDLGIMLSGAPIEAIFTNGQTAGRLYERYLLPQTGRGAVCLPSTSPANAQWRLPQLIEAWRVIDRSKGDAMPR